MSPPVRTWARFCIVGASNAVISYVTLRFALVVLPPTRRLLLAQTIAYAAGLLWSFVWNRRWTFGASGDDRRQLLSFVVLQLALLLATALALEWLATSAGWPLTLAWLAVMVPVTVLNFLVQRAWIFGRDSRS